MKNICKLQEPVSGLSGAPHDIPHDILRHLPLRLTLHPPLSFPLCRKCHLSSYREHCEVGNQSEGDVEARQADHDVVWQSHECGVVFVPAER